MAVGKVILAIIGLCLFSGYSDAAITAWTEPPGITGASGSGVLQASIAETLGTGTSTGNTVAATTGGTIASYTLQATTVNGATFSISTPAGLITYESGTLDFETYPTLDLVVIATDSLGATGTATCTLSVTNIDEGPVFTSGTTNGVCVNDNSGAGTAVQTVTATDPEGAAVSGYDFSTNPDTMFAISSTTGAITVNTGKTLASATEDAYVLVIVANDATTNTGTQTLAVLVGICPSSGVAGLTISMATALVAALTAFLK